MAVGDSRELLQRAVLCASCLKAQQQTQLQAPICSWLQAGPAVPGLLFGPSGVCASVWLWHFCCVCR
jgi:hypothetical protein